MSTLSELVARLKDLPAKKSLRQASQTMKVFRDCVEASTKDLRLATESCRVNAPILGEAGAERVLDQAKKASRKAATLFKRLTPKNEEGEFDIDAIITTIAQKKTDTVITELGEHSKAATKSLKDVWQAQMEQRIAPYRQLYKVAKRLSSRAGQSLAATLQALESSAQVPPSTAKDAVIVSEGIESLKRSIDSLGLHGDAAEFLIRAVDGQADPQELFKKSVKQFFDNDPALWKLLRVTLT